MTAEPKDLIDRQIAAHAAAHAEDIARLRAMSMAERGKLIQAACRTAAILARDRAAAGLPPVKPVPWPASTWEFLRKHAARVRSQSTD
jgi:hypothetical protein